MIHRASTVVITSIFFLCLLILPFSASAACTRTELQTAVDRYITAQKAGNPDTLPLMENARYSENLRAFPAEIGILNRALPSGTSITTLATGCQLSALEESDGIYHFTR